MHEIVFINFKENSCNSKSNYSQYQQQQQINVAHRLWADEPLRIKNGNQSAQISHSKVIEFKESINYNIESSKLSSKTNHEITDSSELESSFDEEVANNNFIADQAHQRQNTEFKQNQNERLRHDINMLTLSAKKQKEDQIDMPASRDSDKSSFSESLSDDKNRKNSQKD